MNRIHRVVFNRATGVFQVVSETARSQGSGTGASTVSAAPRLSRLAAACILGLATLAMAPTAVLADPAPAVTLVETNTDGSNGADGEEIIYNGPPQHLAGTSGTAGGVALTVEDAGLLNQATIRGGTGGQAGQVEFRVDSGLAERAAFGVMGAVEAAAGASIQLGNGGAGGAGVVSRSSADHMNNGDIVGGDGGSAGMGQLSSETTGYSDDSVNVSGRAGAGGAGGDGLTQTVAARVENRGLIAGGTGGIAGGVLSGQTSLADASSQMSSAAGGAGGNGITFTNGGTLINAGPVQGGNAGGSSVGYAIAVSDREEVLRMAAPGAATPVNLRATVTGVIGATGGAGVSFGATGLVENTTVIYGGTGGMANGSMYNLAAAGTRSGGDAVLTVSAEGHHGGVGGAGLSMGGTGNVISNVTNATIQGGAGGNGGYAMALASSQFEGLGRTALDAPAPATLTGTLSATGGHGGSGGNGVDLAGSSTLVNDGYIAAGDGGLGGRAMAMVQEDINSSLALANPALAVAIAGGNGGSGGVGVSARDSTIENRSGAQIVGGRGGEAGDGLSGTYEVAGLRVIAMAGAGGAGITGANLNVINNGSISGGQGGRGGTNEAVNQAQASGGDGGAGAAAAVLEAGSSLLNDGGEVSGGSGGRGGDVDHYLEASAEGMAPPPTRISIAGGRGAVGGAGVVSQSTQTLVNRGLDGDSSNGGDIEGGNGGRGGGVYAQHDGEAAGASYTASSGTGGAGGDGVIQAVAATVQNEATIVGGRGGYAGSISIEQEVQGDMSMVADGATGGAGGNGVTFVGGGTLQNSGEVIGGYAGASSGASIHANMVEQSVAQFARPAPGGNPPVATARVEAIVNAVTGAAGGTGAWFGGLAGVENSGLIEGGEGAGSGGDARMARDSSGGNYATITSSGPAEGTAAAYGHTGGAGGAGLVLTAGGVVSNVAGGMIVGGSGGDGGRASAYLNDDNTTQFTGSATAQGGSGGHGGNGATISGGTVLTNAGDIAGGQGGYGGYAEAESNSSSADSHVLSAAGGNGGAGGAGIAASQSTIVNQSGGTIRGGDGSGGGYGQTNRYDPVAEEYISGTGAYGAGGAGGAGIVGSDLTIVNAGSIAGGYEGSVAYGRLSAFAVENGNTQAAAIQFTGGVNSLTLEAGSDITGKVNAFSTADTLALGGAADSSFDVAAIGPDAQYSGFGIFRKTGGSTWTLLGSNTGVTPWTVAAGVLSVASDASLGNASGALTLAGGTLRTTADIMSARAVNLTGPGGTFNTDADTTLTLSGTVAGDGGLTKDGAGTLHLTGANTYSGATTISAGTLAGRAGSFGTSAIQNDGALVIDEDANTTMGNQLSGAGSLTKTGAGQVLYTGDGSGFTGSTLITAGALSVNGRLGGTTTIGSGAILRGRGTIGSTVLASGATVAPGNSIGTLTVAGNFTFAAGSSYEVETNASGASDLLAVTGTATLGGATVDVVSEAGNYAAATTYTILTSGNRVGTFSGVTSNFAFLDPTLNYVGNNVQLLLTRNNIALESVAATPNQRATAAALQTLGSGAVYNALLGLNAPAARAAFNQVSGEVHASAKTAMLEDSRFVRGAAMDRLRQSQGGTASGMNVQPGEAGSASWARVFASDGRMDGDGNASTLNRDIAGAFVGADAQGANGWRAGVVAGYSKSELDVDGLNSSAKTDSYHLGVYGGTQWDATSLRLGASYTWNKLDTSRNASFAGFAGTGLKAEYDVSTAQLFGEIGHRVDMGRYALEPFAGLAYVSSDADGFSETGGAAALRSGGGKEDVTFSTLGVRAFTALNETTNLHGTLGWRHAFGDRTPSSTQSFAGGPAFTVYGVPLAKDVAVLEAGVQTQLQRNVTLGVSYAGQLGDGLKDHGLKVSLGWKF